MTTLKTGKKTTPISMWRVSRKRVNQCSRKHQRLRRSLLGSCDPKEEHSDRNKWTTALMTFLRRERKNDWNSRTRECTRTKKGTTEAYKNSWTYTAANRNPNPLKSASAARMPNSAWRTKTTTDGGTIKSGASTRTSAKNRRLSKYGSFNRTNATYRATSRSQSIEWMAILGVIRDMKMTNTNYCESNKKLESEGDAGNWNINISMSIE